MRLQNRQGEVSLDKAFALIEGHPATQVNQNPTLAERTCKDGAAGGSFSVNQLSNQSSTVGDTGTPEADRDSLDIPPCHNPPHGIAL